jgi:glycerophosphoryl diester phosphodiesterase
VEVKNLPGEPDHDASDLVCEAVAGLVGAYRPIDQLLVSSFDITAVDRIRAAEPSLPTGWVVVARLGADLTLDRMVAHGHLTVCLWDALVDESIVVSARERGLRVVVWTVDEPDRITQLADWAVDGIITNRPGLARSVIDGHLDG